NAPHGSSGLDPRIRSTVQAPKKYKDLYPPIDIVYRKVDKYRYKSPALVTTKEARARDYRAAVTCMDAAIGDMMDKLEEKRVLDNTIVIFFSDNGGGGGADNSPLRGKKGDTWEGGVRVPCLIRWPKGRVPTGSVNDSFLTTLEIVPSLVAAAGGVLPGKIKFDGYEWWDAVRGGPSPRETMFWKRKDSLAARVGDWKWVSMGKQGGLYDLRSDDAEKHDLFDEKPQVAAQMKQHVAEWLAEMDAAEPRGPFRDF
ncbi:MAG: sulfatase-like hydrolase/transferase, partial [Bacteroidota bacterium]